MTKNFGKKEKRPYDWKDDFFLRAVAEAMRTTDNDTDLARALSEEFTPTLSRHTVCGGLNRTNVTFRLRQLVPDADVLLATRSSRAFTNQRLVANVKALKARINGQPPPKSTRPRFVLPSTYVAQPQKALPDLEPLLDQEGRPVTIDTLSEPMCKFPYYEGRATVFCGRQRTRGAYCASHAQVLYQAPSAKRT